METVINVKTFLNNHLGYDGLVLLCRDVLNSSTQKIVLSFNECQNIGVGTCTLIGGMTNVLRANNKDIRLDTTSMNTQVLNKLKRTGLLAQVNNHQVKTTGSFPQFRCYPKDTIKNPESLTDLIREISDVWIGKRAKELKMHPGDLTSKTFELFHNAFDHSASKYDIFALADYTNLSGNRALKFVIIDFGNGIPYNIRKFVGLDKITSVVCMLFAFEKGLTTRTSAIGGVGLKLLREFTEEYECTLEIISENAIAKIGTNNKIEYKNLTAPFPGTIVCFSISLND
jgi:hypothetical protein